MARPLNRPLGCMTTSRFLSTSMNYTPKDVTPTDFSQKEPVTRPDLGHHLMMTFDAADPHLVNSAERLNREISIILERHGCSIVNVKPQQFEPMGATVVWTLAESHFSIHTWPEHHSCVIDFFTCQPNAAEICGYVRTDLIELFAKDNPRSILESVSIPRGRRVEQANVGEMEGQLNCSLLYPESNDDLLFEEFSPYQHVKVVDTGPQAYGKILLLDGIIQISEVTDAYSVALSEPLRKAEGLTNPLIVGGGDCKIAKHIFESNSATEAITIVDLDEMVTTATWAHFPNLRFSAEEEKKTSMHFVDAAAWVAEKKSLICDGSMSSFTGCIIDCTDPSPGGGVSRSLFTTEFYSNLAECLLPGSVVTQQYSHSRDLEPELIYLREAGYTDISAQECNQMEYSFPLLVVQATTPR